MFNWNGFVSIELNVPSMELMCEFSWILRANDQWREIWRITSFITMERPFDENSWIFYYLLFTEYNWNCTVNMRQMDKMGKKKSIFAFQANLFLWKSRISSQRKFRLWFYWNCMRLNRWICNFILQFLHFIAEIYISLGITCVHMIQWKLESELKCFDVEHVFIL